MKAVTQINFTVKCDLTEEEVRALDALAGYGLDNFLKAFYSGLGKAYLQPHENGLITLFKKAQEMRSNLNQVDEVRKLLRENKKSQ